MVPILIDLFHPLSVLDVDCGLGTWCAAFTANGVPAVHGLDGPWVDRTKLQIPSGDFTAYDFSSAEKPNRPPLKASRYDLVTTFEFLEHLEERHARDVVAFMTRLSDIVVAGAAVPRQGGLFHVNEQLPAYWKEQFAAFGFEAFDALRPLFSRIPGLESHYAQNPVLYFKPPLAEPLRLKLNASVLEALRFPAPWVHHIEYVKLRVKLEKKSISRRLKALIGRR